MYNVDPYFSICIPTYNRGLMLKKAIESVLAQSFNNYEIIVSDDASFEKIQEIVFSFNDKRIKYSRSQHNLGLYSNHNRCVQMATSNKIIFLHTDDELLPGCLEDFFKLSKKKQWHNVGLAFGLYGHIQRLLNYQEYWQFMQWPENFLLWLRVGGVSPSGALFHRQALLKMGGFDEYRYNLVAQDFCLQLSLHGFSMAYIGKQLVARPGDSTFPKMAAKGWWHLAMPRVMGRFFKNIREEEILQALERDIPRWSVEEVATLLRQCSQADLWDVVAHLEKTRARDIEAIKKVPDYRHVRLLRVLGPKLYWPLIQLFKESQYYLLNQKVFKSSVVNHK